MSLGVGAVVLPRVRHARASCRCETIRSRTFFVFGYVRSRMVIDKDYIYVNTLDTNLIQT